MLKTAGPFRGKSTWPSKIIAARAPAAAQQHRSKSNSHSSLLLALSVPGWAKPTALLNSLNPVLILGLGAVLSASTVKGSAVYKGYAISPRSHTEFQAAQVFLRTYQLHLSKTKTRVLSSDLSAHIYITDKYRNVSKKLFGNIILFSSEITWISDKQWLIF